MVGRNGLPVDIVANCRTQPALVTEFAEHVVQQCCYRGFAVCSRNSHEFEFPRRVAVKLRGDRPGGCFRAFKAHEHRVSVNFFGHSLAYHGRRTVFHGCRYKNVAVRLRSAFGYEQRAFLDFARINLHICYFGFHTADCLQRLYLAQHIFKLHCRIYFYLTFLSFFFSV